MRVTNIIPQGQTVEKKNGGKESNNNNKNKRKSLNH